MGLQNNTKKKYEPTKILNWHNQLKKRKIRKLKTCYDFAIDINYIQDSLTNLRWYC